MVTLMRQGGGQYDMVSASGDASLRLIKGGDVQAMNPDLIPDFPNFIEALKSPPHNTVDGVHYGISLQWGPNTLLYNTKKVKPAPTSWSVLYNPTYKGQITIPDNPIQIADAALYLEATKPDLGIKDPYELTKDQFDAAVALLKQQRPLLKKHWALASDEIDLFKNGDAVLGAVLAVPDEHAPGGQGPRQGPDPDRGRDRLGRHLDALVAVEASELRLHVGQVGLDAEGPGPAGDLLRRDAREHEGLPGHGPAERGLVQAVPRRRSALVLRQHQVLEDAVGRLRQRQ